MTHEEALLAARELAASPAAQWIGNKLANPTTLIQRCMRCMLEETFTLPLPAKALAATPSAVPAGFDEQLFAWKRAFHDKHASCPL